MAFLKNFPDAGVCQVLNLGTGYVNRKGYSLIRSGSNVIFEPAVTVSKKERISKSW